MRYSIDAIDVKCIADVSDLDLLKPKNVFFEILSLSVYRMTLYSTNEKTYFQNVVRGYISGPLFIVFFKN